MFLGKVLSFVGYTVTVISIFFVILAVVNPGGSEEENARIVKWTFIVFALIGSTVAGVGDKRKKMFANYELYKRILSSTHIASLEQLAARTNQPVKKVEKNIEEMQEKGLYLELNFALTGEESAPDGSPSGGQTALRAVRCEGCGASNLVAEGKAGNCEYCDSPLSRG